MLEALEGEDMCEGGGDQKDALDNCEAVYEEKRCGVIERKRETFGWRNGGRRGVERCERLNGVLPGDEGVLSDSGERARAYWT